MRQEETCGNAALQVVRLSRNMEANMEIQKPLAAADRRNRIISTGPEVLFYGDFAEFCCSFVKARRKNVLFFPGKIHERIGMFHIREKFFQKIRGADL